MDAGEASVIGARARLIRRRRGLSLDVAAGLAGISKPYLSALERGQRGFNRAGDPRRHSRTTRGGCNRRVIHASCTKHGGARGFANLVMTKRDGLIVLDPHVTGQCVLG